MVATAWLDNKPCHFLTTIHAAEGMQLCIEQAELVRQKTLNALPVSPTIRNIGELILLIRGLATSKLATRPKSGPAACFFQIIDMCANNAFVMYKEIMKLGCRYGLGDLWEKVFQALTSECKAANAHKAPLRAGAVTVDGHLQNFGPHLPRKADKIFRPDVLCAAKRTAVTEMMFAREAE